MVFPHCACTIDRNWMNNWTIYQWFQISIYIHIQIQCTIQELHIALIGLIDSKIAASGLELAAPSLDQATRTNCSKVNSLIFLFVSAVNLQVFRVFRVFRDEKTGSYHFSKIFWEGCDDHESAEFPSGWRHLATILLATIWVEKKSRHLGWEMGLSTVLDNEQMMLC